MMVFEREFMGLFNALLAADAVGLIGVRGSERNNTLQGVLALVPPPGKPNGLASRSQPYIRAYRWMSSVNSLTMFGVNVGRMSPIAFRPSCVEATQR